MAWPRGAMLPAQQCVYRGDVVALSTKRRLLEEVGLVGPDSVSEVHFELETIGHRCLHLLGEDDVAILAGVLGRVERNVGVAKQFVGGGSQPYRDPDTCRRAHAAVAESVEAERICEDVAEAFCDDLRTGVQ